MIGKKRIGKRRQKEEEAEGKVETIGRTVEEGIPKRGRKRKVRSGEDRKERLKGGKKKEKKNMKTT